ncbi:MAG TPA: DUF721 domain-containing protein [Lysobacter sp.]|nr:DUF721 domain-containing protein [Lysobacter sp.]
MSDSRSPRRAAPQRALDALLAEPAGDTVRRALWLDELDRRLRPSLPAPLAAHARLANVDRGRLVFTVDAPVWRAKLRLAAPEILDVARSLGLNAAEVVIKTAVDTATSRPTAPQQSRRTLAPRSAAAQDALRAALASLSSDPKRDDDA